MKLTLFILILSSIINYNLSYSCTIISISKNHMILAAGNEDDNPDWPQNVWVLSNDDCNHARFIFGFADGWLQNSMNDQGLFFNAVIGWRAAQTGRDAD